MNEISPDRSIYSANESIECVEIDCGDPSVANNDEVQSATKVGKGIVSEHVQGLYVVHERK